MRRKMESSALVFDLDGTLLDTLNDLARACNAALQEAGLPPRPVDAYRRMVGNGFSVLVGRAIGRRQITPEKLAEITEFARAWYADHLIGETVPYPGIVQALGTCAAKGSFLGVLSNKPDSLSVELIEHFFAEIPFGFVIGARENRPLKPDPRVLLEELGRFRIPARNVWYVGDSDIDVETARNAGAGSAGVSWGFRGEEELRKAGANLILHKAADIPALCVLRP